MFLSGYSATGTFTDRFAALQPNKVKAYAFGGTLDDMILPLDKYRSKNLIFPIGTYDYEDITGRPFSINDHNSMARLIYMGKDDNNNTVDYGYLDCYSNEEREIIISLWGLPILPRAQALIELYGLSSGIGIFILDKDTGHGMSRDMDEYVLDFFKANRNSSIPSYPIPRNSNQLIIKFKDSTSLSYFSNLSNLDYLSDELIVDIGNNTKIVNVEEEFKDKLIRELESDPSIDYVEQNYIYSTYSVPNDTYYYNLWHMGNIKAEGAWQQTIGYSREVIVAVIDSGIDYTHKDLINKIAPGGYNFLYNNNSFYDYNGHGTFISGIIAAEANNNYGITGLAGKSNVKILPIRVSNYEGLSNTTDIIKAINYCIIKQVDVINLSMGGPQYSYALRDAI